MKNFLFVLLILSGSIAFGQFKIPDAVSYQNGRTLCEVTNKEIIQRQNGFFVPVPVDYNQPEKGQTEIYVHFYGQPFSAKKETLIYFNGGPGQPSHWGLFKTEPKFNQLLMDQRGIGCSRPKSFEQFMDPGFYSSEWTARDAEEVRKFFKIQKLTVYGISYGTVPATLYGHLFPSSTRAVILEGIVYSGEKRLWEAPHRRKVLQKMLNSLPTEIHEQLRRLTAEPGIPPVWFSDLARMQLMRNGGLENLKQDLLSLTEEDSYQHLLKQTRQSYEPLGIELHPLFTTNDIPYSMLSCLEMEMWDPQLVLADALVDGKTLVAFQDTEFPQRCQSLNVKTPRTYYSNHYPLNVPVTYFQGSEDSATTAPEAFAHYKQIPQGFKQLLILKKGGHNPNLELMGLGEEIQAEIFDYAFQGKAVPKALLEKFNQSSEYPWVMTSNADR